jgi:hypothetical protein
MLHCTNPYFVQTGNLQDNHEPDLSVNESGLEEIVADLQHDRVSDGFWHWKQNLGHGVPGVRKALYKSTSYFNDAPLFWILHASAGLDELAGHLVVAKKQDAVGHYQDYYYIKPIDLRHDTL